MSIEIKTISIQMLIKGRKLSLQQRGDAQQELDNLIQKIDQLERELKIQVKFKESYLEHWQNSKEQNQKLEKENKELKRNYFKDEQDAINIIRSITPILIKPIGITKKVAISTFTSNNAYKQVTEYIGKKIFELLKTK